MTYSRRDFLKSSGLLLGGMGLSPAIARAVIDTKGAPGARIQPLETGWQYYEGPLGGPWEAWHLPALGWQPVTVPHCFNHYDACDPDRPAYRGQGWYRMRLAAENPVPMGRTLLHFGGAGQRTTLFAGSSNLGEHLDGYTEFVFDLTDAERDGNGEIPLVVRCDNSRDLSTIPSDLSDFNLYGGLYRHVRLLYVPAIALENVHVVSEVAKGKAAGCSVRARLYNPTESADNVTYTVSIYGPDGGIVHQSHGQRTAWSGMQELAAFSVEHPQLWSPDSPALYRCQLTIATMHGSQSREDRFGLRSFEFVDHGPFLLNGEKLFLRGTQRHEDHARVAAAIPDDVSRKELKMIREMGANFLRLAHYPQAALVLDQCDELGIVVWEELPWCRSGVGDEAMRAMTREVLHTMIDQHYNHPAIVFWSLGNEEDWPDLYPGDGKTTVRGLMQELQKLAHAQDPSRLTAFRRCKQATDVPDVYSPSMWPGWYGGRYQDYEQMLEGYRDKIRHLLHMEWGADSLTGRHEEEPYGEPYPPFAPVSDTEAVKLPLVKHGAWSETYACDLYDWLLKTQELVPWFAGSAQWIFKDFSTPVRPENPIPRVNMKGLVQRDLAPKEGYWVFQSYWGKTPMVHVYGHNWPVRWGREGQERLVRVYSNCKAVELFLNGRSCGVKRRDSQDFPCAGLRWPLKFAKGKNTLRAIGHTESGNVTDEVTFQYQTETWGAPVRLQLQEISRAGTQAIVGVRALDADGVLCLDARNRIRFALAGDGRLMDNLGTATGSRVVELQNGRGQITLQRGSQPAVVTVSSDGLQEGVLKIV